MDGENTLARLRRFVRKRYAVASLILCATLTLVDTYGRLADAASLWAIILNTFARLGTWLFGVVGVAILLIEYLPKWFRQSPFEVRLIHGARAGTVASGDGTTAKIAIKNVGKQMLTRCSARLVNAFLVEGGIVASNYSPRVSEEMGESFLLRWEDNTASQGKYLDIPPDGSERIVQVLRLTGINSEFVAADPSDMKSARGIGMGLWFKLVIRIGSNEGHVATVDIIGACAGDGGPIVIYRWEERGNAILREQTMERKKLNTRMQPWWE